MVGLSSVRCHWRTYSLKIIVSISHCRIISKLCKAPPRAPPIACENGVDVYSVVTDTREGPAWLFQSDELYRARLSSLSASVLFSSAKSCSGNLHKIYCNRSSSISKIIDHYVLERNLFVSSVRNGNNIFSQDLLCDFVEHTERLYGIPVAALLREPPFKLSTCFERRPHISGGLQWFHETTDELVRRLRKLSFKALLCELRKILAHRRPAYDLENHQITLNNFTFCVASFICLLSA